MTRRLASACALLGALVVATPAAALEPPPPRLRPLAVSLGLEMGALFASRGDRLDTSGTNALTLDLDWVGDRWGVSLGVGAPLPAPIAGTGVHVPLDLRYFFAGGGQGPFAQLGVRGAATLAGACEAGDECGEPGPAWRPTTVGALGRVGLGWQGGWGDGMGWRAHASYHAGHMWGGRIGDVGPEALSGLYQGFSLAFSVRFGL